MQLITRPMLAPNDDYKIQVEYFPFPGIYSPKLDGFRCYTANGAKTRSGKNHPNPWVRELVSTLPNGIDGELTVGNNFRDAQSALSKEYGNPEFVFNVFDYVKDNLNKPFCERLYDLNCLQNLPQWVKIVPQYTVENMQQLESFEEWCIANSFEGFMGRKANGIYKCGRSTLKQGLMLKGKRFTDAEAKILDFIEQNTNLNEAFTNELGYTARSSHQENKVPNGLLGVMIVEDLKTGQVFELGAGKGWNTDFRKEVMQNKEKYRNAIIVYKFLDHGNYDLPRNASMKGFRPDWDLN